MKGSALSRIHNLVMLCHMTQYVWPNQSLMSTGLYSVSVNT